jgi:hypothetical protein
MYESTPEEQKNCNDQGQQFTLVLRRKYLYPGSLGKQVGEMYKDFFQDLSGWALQVR